MLWAERKINKLKSAASRGDLQEVARWVEKGVPVNGDGEKGNDTALDLAVYGNYNHVAEYLVKHGATVSHFALVWAARLENADFIECLGKRNISVLPALKEILLAGNLRMLVVAEGQGANMKEALEHAALLGCEDIVCYLVAQKTEVTEQAVKNARANDNESIAELLAFVRDPEEAKAWQEKQKILAEGTVEEKARLKVAEMEKAAQDMCAPDDVEKQERLAKLRKVVDELEKGLNILQQSPHVDFSYTVGLNEKEETAVIKTNIQGKLTPLRLEVSAAQPDTITEYTGDDEGYSMSSHYSVHYRGVQFETRSFGDAGDAVSAVIERAFAKNAVRPEKAAKPAEEARQKAPRLKTAKTKRGRQV